MIVKASVGVNTSGAKAMTYLFTGPGWAGTVPDGMTHISFPTRYMVVLGRTYAQDTKEDLEKVNALQAQFKVMPLSAYGKPYTFVAPPVDPTPGFSMTEAPQEAIKDLGTAGYFNPMTKLMGGAAPPAPEDAPMLARIAKIGVVPGEPFDPGKLDSAVQAALKDVPKLALKRTTAAWEALGKDVNGWRVTLVGGNYGTNYLERGAWATRGWPSAGGAFRAHVAPILAEPYVAFDHGRLMEAAGSREGGIKRGLGRVDGVNEADFLSSPDGEVGGRLLLLVFRRARQGSPALQDKAFSQ